MGFLDDLKASRDLCGKIVMGRRLSAAEFKAYDAIKGQYGLSQAGTLATQEALAECLGVSRQTIVRWKKEGMPVERDGSYDPIKIASWRDLVHPPQADQLAAGGPEPMDDEGKHWDNEYRKYKALRIESTYRKTTGELIERSDVEQLLTERAVEFRRALLDLGRRLSLQLVGLTASEIKNALETAAIDLLRSYTRPHQLGQNSAAMVDAKTLEDLAG